MPLRMTRSCIWNKAKAFYKSALHNPKVLRKNLVIEFAGEEGIHLGALQNDFFSEVLRNISTHLFKGNPTRMVPRSLWGDDSECRMAGLAISHSILLGGPGFRCLHPALYSYVTQSKSSSCAVEDMPCADDIPMNTSTQDLIEKSATTAADCQGFSA